MDIYTTKFYQDNIFYVYMYLRKNNSKNGLVGTPYYIGKGCGSRAYKSHGKNIAVPTDKSRIQFICENMMERDAFRLEIYLIQRYGRVDLKNGCLHNKTDGGEGLTGYKPSKETISKLIAISPASIIKRLETMRKNGTSNSPKKATATKRKNGTLNSNSVESVAKCLATKRKNGTMNVSSPTAIAKQLATKLANGTIKQIKKKSA